MKRHLRCCHSSTYLTTLGSRSEEKCPDCGVVSWAEFILTLPVDCTPKTPDEAEYPTGSDILNTKL